MMPDETSFLLTFPILVILSKDMNKAPITIQIRGKRCVPLFTDEDNCTTFLDELNAELGQRMEGVVGAIESPDRLVRFLESADPPFDLVAIDPSRTKNVLFVPLGKVLGELRKARE